MKAFEKTYDMGFLKRPSWALAAAIMLGFPTLVCAQGANEETVDYRFKAGDTLLGLASRYLEGRDPSAAVQKRNGITDPTKIRPGTVLKIPNRLLRGTQLEARLVAYSGDVTLRLRSKSLSREIGTLVPEGSDIATGQVGFLTISIEGGSKITIPSQSRVRMARLRRYLLNGATDIDLAIDKGRIETSASPIRDPKSLFRLRTPIAVSAVRGTVFRIGYDGPDKPSLTEVVEGSVAVDTGTKPSLVPTGFGIAAPKSGPLAQEELLPAPAVTNAGMIQSGRDLRFALAPIAGAVGYHSQIARDAGFVDIVSESRSDASNVRFDGLPDGTYFVRAMAIAASGLEGLSETFAFRRQLTLIEAISSPQPTSGAFRINWVARQQGKATYRFQLFTLGNENLPLIDEPGLETSGITLTSLAPGSYQWRVGLRLHSGGGTSEAWTRFEKFTVSK